MESESENSSIALTTPNSHQVASVLHLSVAPTTKSGQKEKAEPAGNAAARANGNVIRVGGHVVAVLERIAQLELEVKNQARAFESRLNAKANPGKTEAHMEFHEALTTSAIEALSGRIDALSPIATSDARLTVQTSHIATLMDKLETLNRQVTLITTSSLCDQDGVPRDNFATKADVNSLYGSVQDGFEGLDDVVAEAVRPTTKTADAAALLVARIEAKVAKLEQELLTARENVARLQTELSAHVIASRPTLAAVAPTPLVSAPPRAFEFSVGGKKPKRKASVELLLGPSKRANAWPDKASCQQWVSVVGVNPNPKVAAPALFKQLVETALGRAYSLPTVFIERATGQPGAINVGFYAAHDANAFVGAWTGSSALMPVQLRAITVQHIAAAGSSNSSDTMSFLTGN
ncbi:hypothetical protein C8R47DRAFT_1225753 [Mycena vitilis]|nr:hypothetical protein C8R47DRAFT_1225753 [Mycena vitilis]